MKSSRIASAWIPVLLALTIIATESTDTFSATHTSSTMRPWFEGIFGHVSDGVWWWMHHLFRKSGHFLGYGIVGVTFFRAWRMMLGGWGRPFALGIFSAFLVASADEWHQTFIPSRTGTFTDVLLDTIGATILCTLAWLIRRNAKA